MKKIAGANGYEIYQKKGSGKYTKVKTITSGSTTSYRKYGLVSGRKYSCKIRSYVIIGNKKVYSDFSTVTRIIF